jgi:hypothetical protein
MPNQSAGLVPRRKRAGISRICSFHVTSRASCTIGKKKILQIAGRLEKLSLAIRLGESFAKTRAVACATEFQLMISNPLLVKRQ